MARDIKLNSSEWCEMVFENRNKKYGAYVLRQTSSKRHIIAFIVGMLIVAVLVAIPAFLKAVTPPKATTENIKDSYKLGVVENEMRAQEKIVEPKTPPPPVKLTLSQIFAPPVVKPDEMVDAAKELDTQEKMFTSNGKISKATVISNDPNGTDIADLDKNREITNDPPEEPNRIHEVVEVMPQFPGGRVSY